jgi:hypothetical protein
MRRAISCRGSAAQSMLLDTIEEIAMTVSFPTATNDGRDRYALAQQRRSDGATAQTHQPMPSAASSLRYAAMMSGAPTSRPTLETAHFARTQASYDPRVSQMRARANDNLSRSPNGTTRYSPGITIRGSEAFRRGVVKDLDQINRTRSGRRLIESLNRSGRMTTIREGATPMTAAGSQGSRAYMGNGRTGSGRNAEIRYQPTDQRLNLGPHPWMRNLPSSVLLQHELVHANHFTHGTVTRGKDPRTGVPNEELAAIGLRRNAPAPHLTENTFRREIGLPPRTAYVLFRSPADAISASRRMPV